MRSFFSFGAIESSAGVAGEGSTSTPNNTLPRSKRTENKLQFVAIALYSCATGMPTSRIVSPFLQGLIEVFGSQQLCNKYFIDSSLDTYRAICRILQSSAGDAKKGCLTFDG